MGVDVMGIAWVSEPTDCRHVMISAARAWCFLLKEGLNKTEREELLVNTCYRYVISCFLEHFQASYRFYHGAGTQCE